jgi:hypothetical protein
MKDIDPKELHKLHRQKNIIAKHLKDERDGLYRLKVIPKRTKYKRERITPKNMEKFIENED